MRHSTVIGAPIADVFEWHRRRLDRATDPPWQPLHVLQRGAVTVVGHSSARSTAGDPLVGAPPQDAGRGPLRRSARPRRSCNLVPWTHEHCFEPISDTSTWSPIASSPGCRTVSWLRTWRTGDGSSRATWQRTAAGPRRRGTDDGRGHREQRTHRLPALCAFLSTGGHRVVRLVRSTPGSSSESGIGSGTGTPTTLARPARRSRRCRPPGGRAGCGSLRCCAQAGGARQPHRTHPTSGGDHGWPNVRRRLRRRDLVDKVPATRSSPSAASVATASSPMWCRTGRCAADPRESHGRVTHVRAGIVQASPIGGVLRLARPIFEIRAGGQIGDGRQWTPWISIVTWSTSTCDAWSTSACRVR